MKTKETVDPPTDSTGGVDVPETIQEETRSIISGAFRLFADHNQRLTDDLTEFNETRKKVRENIEHGARRTTGRIV